ncbi:RNA-directed DNA polymerase, eukaryota [Tanacetum coccineum]
MESMENMCVRQCWGNMIFDHAYSDSVGNSGGILCIWDPNSFRKHSVTISDYFVIIRGTWCSTRQNFLMIAVYAPQDSRDKQILWDFLHHEICKWKGEVIIMGDFNEVRYKADRFGSSFNAHGANLFNSFISAAGLIEVSLGGCRFTWCHKSAKKMSKLDRFLVSENLLVSCPQLNAITLERFLSDHRPILLRENHYDYGPTPFWFFHHWIEMEGFCNLVEDTWKNSPCVGSNAMKILMTKLKHLKNTIREWNKNNMTCRKNVKAKYKNELKAVDRTLDSGQGAEKEIRYRSDIILKLQQCEEIDSLEMAQKAKIKWAVEGDENSKFFHGMLNKKRNILNIRGVMVDGVWVDEPKGVKREFFDHFSKRFCKPDECRVILSMDFPNRLQSDQRSDLEAEVTNDEIKKAVWECGTDKAPGPDGFTFLVFFRKSGILMEKEVFDAVKKKQVLIFKVDFEKQRFGRGNAIDYKLGMNVDRVKSILHTLESIRSHFFKGHDMSSKKASWVNWNKADGNIGMVRKVGVKSCWVNIVNEINVLSNKGVNLMKYLRIRLGNGDSTLFWDDPWHVGGILKDRFP